MIKINYCKKCVYPIHAVNLSVDDDNVCTACRVSENFNKIPKKFWEDRKNKFKEILKNATKNNVSNYDCLIPVSGGKDSYFQTHCIVKEFNLKPLLVTYEGNNFLPEGIYNRDRMRDIFDVDHIIWGPSVEVLKKLNRICFKKMGDMNWQNHCGINTAPIILASKFDIPLIIWGETSWDISGMYDINDFVEFSARGRHEHSLRGYEWEDLLDDKEDKLEEKDFIWAKYPTDEEITKKKIKGIYIGNFFKWDGHYNYNLMKKLYSWKESNLPFERTYRTYSNLDDRYENGIHDLMKFIKFGYGRCSDHASKDIRNGRISRKEGESLVKKYDHVVSSDLDYWLRYVEMTKKQFWNIADSFRDYRVWEIKDNEWVKYDIDGIQRSYGQVCLTEDKKNDFVKKQNEYFSY